MSENLEEKINETHTSELISTRSVGIRYGLYMGIVSIAYFVIMNVAGVDTSEGIARWASFIYIFLFLFLGHKYYKDNGNGFMSFGQGMGVAFWTALISSAISSVFTFVYLKFIDDTMIVKAVDKAREQMEAKGNMSEADIDNAMSITSKFMTPEVFGIFGLIFGVIFIVIAGLLVSAVTQKKNPDSMFN